MNDMSLALRQVRYTNKAFWRNPASAGFTFAFPLMFLVIFTALFGNSTTCVVFSSAGKCLKNVKTSTFYVSAIGAFAIITATFTNLAIGVTFQRDAGILKRVRGAPVPAWVYMFGRIVHATAENRDMAEGLGVNASKIFALVFTVGCMLGTVGGALVVPSGAASLDMAVELVVESFAVVVIGGLGSMRGALAGALVVGLMRAAAISLYAELEMLAIYLVVIVVLIARPAGLFGKPVE